MLRETQPSWSVTSLCYHRGMFPKSFFHFFFGFVAIVTVAFGVLIWSGLQKPDPVDNVALPQ